MHSFHGFAAARANLDDPENKKLYVTHINRNFRGYRLLMALHNRFEELYARLAGWISHASGIKAQ